MATTAREFQLGIMFRCQHPPEALRAFAQRAELAGYDELWVVEDCFFGGGIASAGAALAATESIHVGLGIMPAVVRNAAFAAMEIATLARLHPGRFLPGFGHGVAAWMRQIGAFPPSQLAALEEVTAAVRALLRGEAVTVDGRYVQLDHVQLEFPPAEAPLVALGVRGPKSLALAGRAGDGTILAEGSSPAYIRWARDQIAMGQQEAGRTDTPHRVTVFVLCSVGADPAAARQDARRTIARIIAPERFHPQLEPLGIVPQLRELLDAGGPEHLAANMPDEWVDQLAVTGTPDQCVQTIQRFAAAGAQSVVLVPPGTGIEHVTRIGDTILPLLRR